MTQAIERLTQLLEAERAALLEGNLDAVGALAGEKEQLADTFETAGMSELQSLSDALARNAALLSAAQDGVSTVLQTLRNQREARASLSSYDRSGNATTISNPTGGTLRRF